MTKEEYISHWEAGNYPLPDDYKERMCLQLSFYEITAKLREMSAWQEVGGIWKL